MVKAKAQLEGKSREERIEQRRKLGSLQSLAVQPATKHRYDAAINKFLDFLKSEQFALPKQRSKMDDLLAEYIEHLWSSGEGRALASDTLAGIYTKFGAAFEGEFTHCVATPESVVPKRLTQPCPSFT